MTKKKISIVFAAIAVIALIFSYSAYQSKLNKIGTEAKVQYKQDVADAEVRKQERELEKKKENTNTILPERIYMMEDSNSFIYLKNVIKSDIEDLNIDLQSDFVEVNEDKWSLDTENNSGEDKEFTVELTDQESNVLSETTHNLEIVSPTNNNQVNLLSIGDSMTRPNSYGKRVQEILPNVQTVGTRTFDNGLSNGEGRGGWTLQFYMSKIGEENGLDSPFLFPTEISGEQYKGNVNFWKNVCYDNPESYEYDGFQKKANGWNGETCLYDKNGYPKNPNENDVVVDPSFPTYEKFLMYNGTEWQPMEPQPDVEFSFSKYAANNEEAFKSNEPNVVSILFGANDFYATNGTPGIERFIENISAVEDSIREYNPDIKFIVNLPIIGSNQDVWENREGVIQGSSELYRENMQLLSQTLIDEYDKREDEEIYVSATNAFVDTSQLADHIHPTITGYEQMGDALGALIQSIR